MNLNSVMIGSENPKVLAEYYTKIFGKPTWDEGGMTGWQIGSGGLMLASHDQVKGKNTTPGRILLNIETPDVKQRFDEFKAAGATVVQEPYQPEGAPSDMLVCTFADPDNNYFQLVSPM
ncbi:MAG TPA: VOC family protein [Actinomycetota bacterium]|nr:VOC family protein [Actinomycetota bacterium]